MKRRTSRLLSILLALCLALALLPGTALAIGYFDPETGTITGCDFEDTEVNIPSVIDGVPITSIIYWAFRGHSNLISVTIPESVTSIGSEAFLDCTSLTSINVASGNPAYSSVDGVLFNADQTVLIAYPAGKTNPTYSIPASVTTIERSAFLSCASLTGVTIPGSVTTIDDWAFAECGLTSVIIPDSVNSIGAAAFQNCAGLTNVTIPDSVTSIGSSAFANCASLTSVTIPGGVARTGDSAFIGCASLTSVTLLSGVTTIGDLTFQRCGSLTSVTIPDSVTRIGNSVFSGCDSLTDVYYGGDESQWEQIYFAPGNDLLRGAAIHYNSAGPAPSASESIPVTVNGKAVTWTDAAPFIDENDRTMVPLRAVADAMRLDVNWDENTREASFTGSGKTITFPIGSATARGSEGEPVQMDTAAVIVNERTYAPIRYLAEYFGYTVGWDEAARAVTITG